MNRFNALNFVHNEVKKLFPEARVTNTGRYLTITGATEPQDEQEPPVIDKIEGILDMDELGEAEVMETSEHEGQIMIGYELP